MDGTLLGADGQIARSDSDAIRELQRRGVPVTLCTGRMYSGTRAVAARLGVVEPLGCIDGSHIVDAASGRELATAPLAAERIHALLGAVEEHGPAAFVFSSDRVYFDDEGSGYLPYVTTWSDQTEQLGSVLESGHWDATRPIAALVALGERVQVEGVHDIIQAHHDQHLQSVYFPLQRESFEGVWGLIVRAARVDKGTALEWLATHYGVTVAEMVTVGDWFNDVPMLERAGCSFAMAQAPDEVKAAAKNVLVRDIWAGGGVREAAERSGLL
ncbi:MAG TPA: HAD-IIB family hydrolase [Polyangiaceae bacterium]|nr:HAD-IIB family hydrolase [Polyangiaceae bacterium]